MIVCFLHPALESRPSAFGQVRLWDGFVGKEVRFGAACGGGAEKAWMAAFAAMTVGDE